jgi:DNA-binding transcriptional MerR regulator
MAPKARVQKRLYYKIGEACKALGIQPYVLRYWETEFPALSPSKSRSGQRVYSEKELEIIRRIKQLLYDEGYTIAGAKKKLEGELAAGILGELGGSPAAQAASSPPAPAAAPVLFQAQAAARAAERISGSAPAGEGVAAGAGADGVAPGPARTAPLPLVPWAAPGGRSDAVGASSGPATAVAAVDPAAGHDGSGTAAHSAAAEEPWSPVVEPGSSRGRLESPPTLPLTPPPPIAPATSATPAGSPPESAAPAAAGAAPRKATSRQAPVAAKASAAAVAGDGAAGAAASAPAAAAPAPANELDTNAAKQIETLRKGITKALQGAREILALLDTRSPQ